MVPYFNVELWSISPRREIRHSFSLSKRLFRPLFTHIRRAVISLMCIHLRRGAAERFKLAHGDEKKPSIVWAGEIREFKLHQTYLVQSVGGP